MAPPQAAVQTDVGLSAMKLPFLIFLLFAVSFNVMADDSWLNVGTGIVLLNEYKIQKYSDDGTNYEARMNYESAGFFLFLDVARFATVRIGYLLGLGPGDAENFLNGSEFSNMAVPNTVQQLDLETWAKYPIAITKSMEITPSIGLRYTPYVSDGFNSDLNPSRALLFSPFQIGGGFEFTYKISDHMFFRFPLSLGVGLNSNLGKAYYSGSDGLGKYGGSSDIDVGLGFEVGSAL